MRSLLLMLLGLSLVGCDELEVKTYELYKAKKGQVGYATLTVSRTAGSDEDAIASFVKNSDKIESIIKGYATECNISGRPAIMKFRIPIGGTDVLKKDSTQAIAGLACDGNGEVRFVKSSRLDKLNEALAKIHPKLKLDFDQKMRVKIVNNCEGGVWIKNWNGEATNDEQSPCFVDSKIEIEYKENASALRGAGALFVMGEFISADKMSKERKLLIAYHKLRSDVGVFPSADSYSSTEDKWGREIAKGLKAMSAQGCDESVQSVFSRLIVCAEKLASATQEEVSERAQIVTVREKLQMEKSNTNDELLKQSLNGILQAVDGDKSSGRANFFGAVLEAVKNERSNDATMKMLETEEKNLRATVIRVYGSFKDAEASFEARAGQYK